jgi:hypothetical protein
MYRWTKRTTAHWPNFFIPKTTTYPIGNGNLLYLPMSEPFPQHFHETLITIRPEDPSTNRGPSSPPSIQSHGRARWHVTRVQTNPLNKKHKNQKTHNSSAGLFVCGKRKPKAGWMYESGLMRSGLRILSALNPLITRPVSDLKSKWSSFRVSNISTHIFNNNNNRSELEMMRMAFDSSGGTVANPPPSSRQHFGPISGGGLRYLYLAFLFKFLMFSCDLHGGIRTCYRWQKSLGWIHLVRVRISASVRCWYPFKGFIDLWPLIGSYFGWNWEWSRWDSIPWLPFGFSFLHPLV